MKYNNFPVRLMMLVSVCLLLVSGLLSQSLTAEQRAKIAAANVGCEDGWDTAFTPNGVNGEVKVIVPDGAGGMYIGGRFTSVNGVPAVGIARWNGTSWSALGSGVGGTVTGIALLGSDVYISGGFGAGGTTSQGAAKWDGTSWSALGGRLGGGTHGVNAVAVYNGEVYFGGNFNTADGSPATGIVKWDGTAYSSVGTLAGQVETLAVNGGFLYAGGFVAPATGTGVGLIRWDGTTWTSMGLSANSSVSAIGFNGSEIWVGGDIRTPTGNGNVGRWNGTAWSQLGAFSNFPAVRVFAFSGTDVFVGGTFERSGGVGVGNGILRYNGSQWSAIGSGTEYGNHTVNAILTSGNTMLIGGDFQLAGGIGARNIATLTNGTTWAAAFPGTGVDGPVTAVAVSGADVYVAGGFFTAGPTTANRIAKWNSVTNTWTTLGTGFTSSDSGTIGAMAAAGGKLYVGGGFSNMGGVSANNIAVWNGTSWSALGSGLNGSVSSIIVRGEEIYVGGSFSTAGGVPANKVAKWNGTAWTGLNSSILPNAVSGMAFLGGDLYVGTGTTTVANPAYFTKYDGTTWTALGADLGDRGVSSVAVVGNDVYVAGGFTSINGVTVNRVAKWNGSTWSPLGSGLPSPTGQFGGVRLIGAGNDVFAIGDFTEAAGGPGNRIARWNGTAWAPLGTGLDTGASTIEVAGGDVFVGGGFTTAGCNSSPFFARWRQIVWTGSSNSDWHTPANWGGSSVPPANAGITIAAADVSIAAADVTVSSLLVTNGRTLNIAAGRTLTVTGRLDLTNANITGAGTIIADEISLNGANITGLAAVTAASNLYLNNGSISGSGPVTLASCRSSALVGGGPASYIASPFTRCVGPSGTYRFPVSAGGGYIPVDVSGVMGGGNFTVEAKAGPAPSATGLPASRLQRWWNMNAAGVGQADLVFSYLDADVVGIEGRYRAYSIASGAAQLVPTLLDRTANKATVAGATSFAAWTLAESPATFETLRGRITTPANMGAHPVFITLRDDLGNERQTMTNQFGYYRFLNVETWKTYTLELRARKYNFTPAQRTLELVENAPAVNFVSTNH